MKSPGAPDTIKSVKSSAHEKELNIPAMEHLKSIPEFFGIRVNEEPPYEVLRHDGDFEVRRYQHQVLAEVTLAGTSFDQFREQAFKKLAAYLFGENHAQTAMKEKTVVQPTEEDHKKTSETLAMTSPVLQQEGLAHEWTMSFVLPKQYSLETAPKPLSREIQLREVQAFDAAVARYSGVNTAEKVKENEAKLMTWIRKQSDLQLNGGFFAAQYDAPFVIPFLRRNEVMVKVVKLQS